ncbi:flagellar assembly protein H [Sphingomonas sp. AP4-R1]|uniref:FliH/SctL family protein n=1 Tax=Sphingomonas sp. AP4-R1 TaxID=2735134 RepID=UPI0014935556|nr:FliH/SctL family protein [Sphingomonas sp. AP4-R1]QJU57435.1 flagellar assembly protein H [Sphingomonas sp. AP4-R1]
MEIKPFGFSRSFEIPGSQVAAELGEDLLAEMTTLRATIVQMRARHGEALLEARREGFEVGRTHASGEQSGALLAATDALHAALDNVDLRLSDQIRAIHRDAVDLALAAAATLAGHAIDFAPGRAVDEALDRALEQVERGTGLVIRVHPKLTEVMEERLATRIARERRKLNLTLMADETIQPGDGQISWKEGALGVDAAARRAALVAELAPLLDPAAPGTKESDTANIADQIIL